MYLRTILFDFLPFIFVSEMKLFNAHIPNTIVLDNLGGKDEKHIELSFEPMKFKIFSI
jgi:hypothetical protein